MESTETNRKKILLKLNGELFEDISTLYAVIEDLCILRKDGFKIALLVGGGNIVRGENLKTVDRVTGDRMGMLATVINGMHLKGILQRKGIKVEHYSAVYLPWVKFFNPEEVRRDMESKIVVLSGGTSNPYFTTDTASVLRAIEIGAKILIKGTKVDGVYDKDPLQYSDAKFFSEIDYSFALKNNLRVMDKTAFTLAEENNLVILVINIYKKGNILKALKEGKVGTVIKKGGKNV